MGSESTPFAAALHPDDAGSEIEALELTRRVSASDVSHETLDRLDRVADSVAMAYATTPPAELLPRVRRHLEYVTSLVDARKTLAQHRRLLVVGGWLALLRATLHVDLRQEAAADAYLITAAQLAAHASTAGQQQPSRSVICCWQLVASVTSRARRAPRCRNRA